MSSLYTLIEVDYQGISLGAFIMLLGLLYVLPQTSEYILRSVNAVQGVKTEITKSTIAARQILGAMIMVFGLVVIFVSVFPPYKW